MPRRSLYPKTKIKQAVNTPRRWGIFTLYFYDDRPKNVRKKVKGTNWWDRTYHTRFMIRTDTRKWYKRSKANPKKWGEDEEDWRRQR